MSKTESGTGSKVLCNDFENFTSEMYRSSVEGTMGRNKDPTPF